MPHPDIHFLVGTVNQSLTMNGLAVRTQFGRLCLQMRTRDPSQPFVHNWWGPHCTDGGSGGIGRPADNHWIELVYLYYES